MSPLRLAVPNKGRLREPALTLLADAGVDVDASDRSLIARAANQDLEILFARTGDVIEFVADGVADLGITGEDLLLEAASELPVVRRLGFGRCRLSIAVPVDAPWSTLEQLAGLRIATSHPSILRRLLAERSIAADVIPLSGAVEVAPRLGVADAIADLVATGSTLVVNGLRVIEDLLASEAVLVANPDVLPRRAAEVDALDTVLGAVLAARGRTYLMMNAPRGCLEVLEALLPGLESPSIVPLAHEGMVAIHSVVPSDDVWSLLPRLKAAGASGLLALPIEKLVP
ncbi:MAG TPA: ATP phosphoribosyltransferase [Candidatus Limnocylindrales bacterium]